MALLTSLKKTSKMRHSLITVEAKKFLFYQQIECLGIHWRLSLILKTSEKAYEVMLFDM